MIRTSLLLMAALATPCAAQTKSASVAAPNQLTAAERAAGWRLLFDGHTLTGWRGLGYDSVPTAHWVVLDGTIKKIASGNVPRVADGRPLILSRSQPLKILEPVWPASTHGSHYIL